MKIPSFPLIGLPLRPQIGVTLIELMISMVIGLVLVLFVGTLFLTSKSSFRLNDDNARLQEDASYALNLIGRNLMQAGYGNVVSSTSTDFANPDGSAAQGLKGCDNGFKSPVAAPLDFDCAVTGSPSMQVSYRVEDTYDANTGAGADCNGQNASKTPAAILAQGVVINRFFLSIKAGDTAPSLYCNGNGGTVAGTVSQPVLGGVEGMTVFYGADTNGTFTPDQYLTAAGVEALPLSATNKKNWNQVVSVQVCLLVSSPNDVTGGNRNYTDCSGTAKTATDNKLRKAYTKVFTLRNNATPSLVY